jgi:hypothetical protein
MLALNYPCRVLKKPRHLKVLLVTTVLALIPVSAISAQKITPGSTCKVLNQKVVSLKKTHTCVKSGKKLVWNKGVVIKKQLPVSIPAPAPVPAPTPTAFPTPTLANKPFTPWDTGSTGKEINDAAQKNFRDWAKDQASKPLNHQFVIQEGVYPNRAKSLTAVDQTGSKLFSQFFSTKSITVIGRSEDWVIQKLNSLGGNFNECSLAYVDGVNYCWDGVALQGMVVLADAPFDPFEIGRDGSSLLAHEYFHLVQSQLSNPDRYMIKDGTAITRYLFPAWLVEGSAEFAGYSVAALSMGSDYWQGRERMFNPVSQNALEDAEIRVFIGTQPNGPIDPYGIGRAATEYLVASVGFQKLLDVFALFKETRDFEKSFERATGVSTAYFYSKFELVRSKLGMDEVSMKLVCLTNTPLKDVPQILPNCVINATQTSPNKPTPSTSPRSPDDLNGLFCKSEGEIVVNSVGEFWCLKVKGQLLWNRNNPAPGPIPTPRPTP